MAHNNGMVPRSRGKGRSAKASENSAKFAAAVEAGPSLADAAHMDPADLAPPLAAMTAGGTFVPHRPARPEKSEGGKKFKLVSEYQPAGDQPTAIAELVKGVEALDRDQVLLGVTGSGKTYTMAQVIERTQPEHGQAQQEGRHGVFRDYRLRVAHVLRDYGMNDRKEVPADLQKNG